MKKEHGLTRAFSKKGFTLIELLVVIVVIAVLAVLIIIRIGSAQADARDSRRKADIGQIQKAIDIYVIKNGQYPAENWCDSSIGSCGYACPCTGADDIGDWAPGAGIVNSLVGSYIAELPKDPINNSTYYYEYEPDAGG